MAKRIHLSLELAGRDLKRIEQVAQDLGLTPEELMQQASDSAAQKLFVLPTRHSAKVLYVEALKPRRRVTKAG